MGETLLGVNGTELEPIVIVTLGLEKFVPLMVIVFVVFCVTLEGEMFEMEGGVETGAPNVSVSPEME